ncbi:MAG: PQQ-binding-like beta-propeller repeat protein [Parachlamydiales bacterium]
MNKFWLLVLAWAPCLWGTTTDGTMWGGTIGRSGDYPTAGVPTAPNLLWSTLLDGPIATTPAPAPTRVYVATTRGTFYALDRTTGLVVWKRALRPPTYGSPAVDVASDRVFVSDGRGLHAFVASTGAELFFSPAAGPVLSSAGENASIVFVGVNAGVLKAEMGADGSPVWESDLLAPVTASASIDPVNSLVYTATHEGKMVAARLADGVVAWEKEVPGTRVQFRRVPIDTTPAFDGAVLVAVNGVGELVRIVPTTGDLVWSVPSECLYGVSPTLAHSNVYAVLAGATLMALDPTDGSEVWRYVADANLAARSVANTDGLTDSVYIADVLGCLYALDPTDGSERWRYETHGGFYSDVAVSEGVVFAGTLGGMLFALEEP